MTVPPASPPPPPAAPPPGAPPAPVPPGGGVPWERREQVGFFAGLLGTASESLFQPVSFFRRLNPAGPVGPPLVYAVLVALAAFVVQVVWDLALPNPFRAWMPVEDRAAEGVGLLVVLGVAGLLVPVFVPVAIVVMSAIYHGLLLLFGGPTRGFPATLRVTSYASSAQLIAMIPLCGAFLALVWGVVLQVLGLREVHGVPTGKAVAAVLVPFLLCAVAVLAVVALVLAGIAGAAAGLR